MSTDISAQEQEASPPASRPVTQKEKASRWDHLIALLQRPEIRDTYIWRLATLQRAVNILLASREELPPALVAELVPYKEKLGMLRLDAIDGFDGTEGILNFFPTYVTESLIGQLCQKDHS
jgi:hypothetical protein